MGLSFRWKYLLNNYTCLLVFASGVLFHCSLWPLYCLHFINNLYLKYFSLIWQSNLTQKFLSALVIPVFIRTILVKLLLCLDLLIIAFLRDLVIKAMFLKCRIFAITAAILFKMPTKIVWKVLRFKFISRSSSHFRSVSNFFQSNLL